MATNYSRDNGTSTIVYKIDKWSVRNILVAKLNDALILNNTPSPIVLKVENGVHRNSLNITLSADVLPTDLTALDNLIKASESILYDKLSESLKYMRSHS